MQNRIVLANAREPADSFGRGSLLSRPDISATLQLPLSIAINWNSIINSLALCHKSSNQVLTHEIGSTDSFLSSALIELTPSRKPERKNPLRLDLFLKYDPLLLGVIFALERKKTMQWSRTILLTIFLSLCVFQTDSWTQEIRHRLSVKSPCQS